MASNGAAYADADYVRGLLNEVLKALERVPFFAALHAEMAGLGPRDLQGALRWSGARLADLCDRIRG